MRYNKANAKIKDKIAKKEKENLKNKELLNQIDINGESNCFFKHKDLKENFQNNPTVRLINPAKKKLEELAKLFQTKLT